MNIAGRHYRAIELADDPSVVRVIDQRLLPFRFELLELRNGEQAAEAIRNMTVRGAPLIGATAAYGLYLAALTGPDDADGFARHIAAAADELRGTRPTAVNLFWAIDRVLAAMEGAQGTEEKRKTALRCATEIADEDVERCRSIGRHGLEIIREIAARKSGPVNILTHCNAGWLACVDYGTATAPIYTAFEEGIDLHVWVDETRPRNQGARLTAFELGEMGVPHTVVVDNAGGHLMQHGRVDLVLVGADRATERGDVCNKIGTYLKALAARDNDIPFYAALPTSTIDSTIDDALREITIEERSPDEVRYVTGEDGSGEGRVLVLPPESPVSNPGFDVTPARLVTGIITESGIRRTL